MASRYNKGPNDALFSLRNDMVVTVMGARTSRLVYLRLQVIIVGKARGKNGLKHEMRISSPFGRGSCSHRHCCRTCRCGCRCPLSNLWWFRVDNDACYYNTLHARAVLHLLLILSEDIPNATLSESLHAIMLTLGPSRSHSADHTQHYEPHRP